MIPLRELDLVILAILSDGPLGAEELGDALDARRATRKAQPAPRRRIRPGWPGWPRIRFCSMSDPDIDNHGFVALNSAVMRLHLSELVCKIEGDGAPKLTLSEKGRETAAGAGFATIVAAAERGEGWDIPYAVLSVPLAVLAISVAQMLTRLF